MTNVMPNMMEKNIFYLKNTHIHQNQHENYLNVSQCYRKIRPVATFRVQLP